MITMFYRTEPNRIFETPAEPWRVGTFSHSHILTFWATSPDAMEQTLAFPVVAKMVLVALGATDVEVGKVDAAITEATDAAMAVLFDEQPDADGDFHPRALSAAASAALAAVRRVAGGERGDAAAPLPPRRSARLMALRAK